MTDDVEGASLWDWALAAYARPGAETGLLDLQSRHDTDSCLLIWCVWLDQIGAAPELFDDLIDRGARLSALWRRTVVEPLRGARNRLAAPPPEIPSDRAAELRREVLDTELHAERLQLEALEAISPAAQADAPKRSADQLAARLCAAQAFKDVPADEVCSVIRALRGA